MADIELDLLSKKWRNNPNNLALLQSVLKDIITAIQDDMWGDHSDDPKGTYDAKLCNLPIDTMARQVTICRYPDPHDASHPEQHEIAKKWGSLPTITTGALIQLFADALDSKGHDNDDSARGLYTEMRILESWNIQLAGYIINAARKKIAFDLTFALEKGHYEIQ